MNHYLIETGIWIGVIGLAVALSSATALLLSPGGCGAPSEAYSISMLCGIVVLVIGVVVCVVGGML